MFYAKIADMVIRIDNKYDYIKQKCLGYICSEQTPDMTVSASEEEINEERLGTNAQPWYLETLAVYRKIAAELTKGDGLLIHGVILNVDNTGIAFLANSGTGKSTHMFLWKKLLGDRCTVVNGDKPLIRIKNGIVYAYGTPWAGKENIQTNAKIPLNKICFLDRADENSTVLLDKSTVLPRLYTHIYQPKNGLYRSEIFEKLDTLIRFADFYSIKCNMDISAAKTAYSEIMKPNKTQKP